MFCPSSCCSSFSLFFQQRCLVSTCVPLVDLLTLYSSSQGHTCDDVISSPHHFSLILSELFNGHQLDVLIFHPPKQTHPFTCIIHLSVKQINAQEKFANSKKYLCNVNTIKAVFDLFICLFI